MGWIESDSFWFLGPDFADIFERRKPSQGLQPACVIVGVDEVGKVVPELVVVVIVVALDGRLLDGPVHPLDLTVRPGVFRFRQAMLDAVAPTGPIEWMAAALGRGPIPVPRHIGELNAVIGQDGMDLVGNGFGKGVEEGRYGHRVGALDDLDEGELRRPVDGDIEVELAFGCADLRQRGGSVCLNRLADRISGPSAGFRPLREAVG